MKIRFLPRVDGYTREYSLEGEVLSVTVNGQTDTFDLSALEPGDRVVDVESDLPCGTVKEAERDLDGVLHVTLYEAVPAGIDRVYDYSEWFDGLPTVLPERGFFSVDNSPYPLEESPKEPRRG